MISVAIIWTALWCINWDDWNNNPLNQKLHNKHSVADPVYISNLIYLFLGWLTDFPLKVFCFTKHMALIYVPICLQYAFWPIKVITYKLLTCKFTNSLSRRFSCWMIVWVGLHITLVNLYEVSSFSKVLILFRQFGLLILFIVS